MEDAIEACPPKPALHERPLIGTNEAETLASTFKLLANDTRLRLLHALVREPRLSVVEVAGRVGMKPQAVSNQLQRLLDRRIVRSKRDGNHVRYWVEDPCTVDLLHQGLCLTEDSEA